MAATGLGQVVSWYICTVVAVLFLVARIWVRLRRFGKLGLDDGFLVLATACLIGDCGIQQHMWNEGVADLGNASRANFVEIMKMIIPGSTLYVTSLWAIKVALVLFYKKLAGPNSRLQTVYNVTLCVLAATWAAIFFDIIFQCYPNDKRWSTDPTYQCDPQQAENNYWMTILLNIFSDVAIICMPITMVMRLQMKMRQKLGVAAIFSLGFFVVIASIIRAIYSKRNETMLTCTVSMVETAVAIIATCLPPLRSLFIRDNTSAGNASSNYGRYELSSTGHNVRRTQPSAITTNIIGGTQKGNNDSEDDLIYGSDGPSKPTSMAEAPAEDKNGISVSTTFQMYHEGLNAEKRYGDE